VSSVLDVAAYILGKKPGITAMKLQKLAYYSLAWHSVWSDDVLFPETFQAWANGPVSPVLYGKHRGQFLLQADAISEGRAATLSEDAKDSIDRVLESYGDKTSQWLSDLTHAETPWIKAREGVVPGERSDNVISLASMNEYYAAL
jgi:uncharacterized phage-associated protein